MRRGIEVKGGPVSFVFVWGSLVRGLFGGGAFREFFWFLGNFGSFWVEIGGRGKTSFIFLILYIHIFKVIFLCLLFDSHLLVWGIGFIIFILVIVIAFLGYILPCTSMSYWGLTVISNVLATVPIIGVYLCNWVWGSEFINDYTLVKVHSIHIFLPFLLGFVVIAHFFALHYFLSSDGLMDRFAFYYERYFFFMLYYLRDLYLVLNLFFVFIYFICIYWYFVFHEESWEIVNILKTSDKILPEFWA
jgi:ubiquinol-cytochrome c reductase cytochrome b subunit